MTSASEEDWSIISSSDMDDQSTTSSVRYDDDSQDHDDTTPASNSDDDIDSTIEIHPVAVPASGIAAKQPDTKPKCKLACLGHKIINVVHNIDGFFRSKSEHWYDIYLNDYIVELKEDIETPSLRYKVESWQKFSNSTHNEPLFKVRKQNLYIHDRIAYEIILFLQTNKSLLFYYVMAVVGGMVTLSYVSINYLLMSLKLVPKPKSLTDNIEQYFSTLFTPAPVKSRGVMSYFKKSAPVASVSSRARMEDLLKRFESYITVKSSQFHDLWSLSVWKLSTYSHIIKQRSHWLFSLGQTHLAVYSAKLSSWAHTASGDAKQLLNSTANVSRSIIARITPIVTAKQASRSIFKYAKTEYYHNANKAAAIYAKYLPVYVQYGNRFVAWCDRFDAEAERGVQKTIQIANLYKPFAKLYKNKFDKFAFSVYQGFQPLVSYVKEAFN